MNQNYVVKKSNFFIMNSSYDLSLEEQKLILTLASMVQPTDEEFKAYKFKIADFIALLGVENQSKYSVVPKITKELMKKVFEIQENNSVLQVAWLSSVRYEKGSGVVTLKFSPDLKPYMLQLKEKFTQYQLANVLTMKSKYSPRFYEILKCNEFRKQGYIEIEVDDLRYLLKAENIYPRHYDFKKKIIIQVEKELKEKTDISFDFEEIKTGRKVTSIKFYIRSNKKTETKKGAEESTEDLEKVKSIFAEDITDFEAKKILDAAKNNIEFIKEKYKIAQDTSKIKNLVAWMIDAIQNDYKAPQKRQKSSSFCDYDQRFYSTEKFKELEKRLINQEEAKRAEGQESELETQDEEIAADTKDTKILDEVKTKLRDELSEKAFLTWINTLKQEKIEDDILYIKAQTEFAAEVVKTKYIALIKSAVENLDVNVYYDEK